MHCLRWNSASAAIYNPDHSTRIAGGSKENGKSAKGKKESPFACRCRSRESHKPMVLTTRQQKRRHATPSGFERIGLCSPKPRGEDTYVPPIPGFDIDTALRTLNIIRTPFDEMNGNIQGFANGREIAVNPVAALPHKTTFHEIAHIVLGHTTSEKLVDTEQTARHIREVEAESVALICCETLGLDGADFCRGYIQHWLKTEKEIPNQSAARIFAAATSILKAGTAAAGSQ